MTARLQLIYAVRDVIGCWDAFNDVNAETLTDATREAFRVDFEGKMESLREALDRLR